MIKTTYDPEADVLHVTFEAADAVYDGAQEVSPGVNFEFDTAGRLMGIEVLSVSRRLAGRYGATKDAQAAAE